MQTRKECLINIEANSSEFLFEALEYLKEEGAFGNEIDISYNGGEGYTIEIGDSKEYQALHEDALEPYTRNYIDNMIACDGYWGMWIEDFILRHIDIEELANQMGVAEYNEEDWDDNAVIQVFKDNYLQNGYETRQGHAVMNSVIDRDDFISDAIEEDGEALFIARYDGQITRKENYVFWRVN